MFKLLKYEFRKARTSLLTLLGLTAGLELYFLFSLYGSFKDHEDHLVASVVMLMMCTFAVSIFVLIRGVTSYSSELRSRSGYLIFLTPNSAVKIIASKYFYTFVNSLLFAGLFAVLAGLDIALVWKYYGEYENMINGIVSLLRMYGVYVDNFLYAALFFALSYFLSILSTIAVAYFAITLSHTLLRDSKARWIVAVVLFFAMNQAVGFVSALFPAPLEELVIFSDSLLDPSSIGMEVQLTANMLTGVLIPYLIPQALLSLAVIIASMFGCAWMLERKVNL